MTYEEIVGYVDVSSVDQKHLINSNPEYAKIDSIIKAYETCLWLERKYFSRQEWINENDPEFRESYYVYDSDLAKDNKEFFEKWPKKKERIIEKLNTRKYLFQNNKIRDKKALEDGEVKYNELNMYYENDNDFNELKKDLEEKGVKSNSGDVIKDYMIKLYDKRQEMVNDYLQEKQESSSK